MTKQFPQTSCPPFIMLCDVSFFASGAAQICFKGIIWADVAFEVHENCLHLSNGTHVYRTKINHSRAFNEGVSSSVAACTLMAPILFSPWHNNSSAAWVAEHEKLHPWFCWPTSCMMSSSKQDKLIRSHGLTLRYFVCFFLISGSCSCYLIVCFCTFAFMIISFLWCIISFQLSVLFPKEGIH